MRSWTFDPDERVPTLYAITSRGPGGTLAKGTLEGNTWRFAWKRMVGGRPADLRGTLVEESPALARWKVEQSVEGGPWTVISDGTFARVK